MLEEIVKQYIHEKGSISQSQFMELALHHPELGYYRKQESISRDFTTAPEISQVFGELIGAWATDIFVKLGNPNEISLIELGPGKGTLMKDFLRVAHNLYPPLFQAIDLSLVEIHPELKALQTSIHHPNIHFAERMEDIPQTKAPLMIIANEFFDALPTDYFMRQENQLFERHLILEQDQLQFSMTPIEEDQGPDHSWEYSESTHKIINDICDRLLQQTGVFLCIDYGYESGQGETLQAINKGEYSNPLLHIGESDLTCHVDFSAIKNIALSKGLGVSGPISQGSFLTNLGIEARFNALKNQNPTQTAQLNAAHSRLTHPQQMGSLFKVLAVYSPSTLLPEGFQT